MSELAPRIIALNGAPHPQARIDSVDAASGVCIFAWLDAQGRQVDSGGSIARFLPAEPLVADPEVPGEEPTYPEIGDVALAAAIEALASEPAPVPAAITRSQFVIALRRVLGLTEGAVFAVISQLPAGEQQETARDLWENQQTFHRDNSFLNLLATMNGNTQAQLDEVFRTGAALDLS